MSKTKDKISRRDFLRMASPLGKIEIDSSRCTACGLCAAECTTGALTFSPAEETGTVRLLFKYGECIPCNRCVEICPEDCLRLERIVELEGLKRPAKVLFEDEIVRCAECGLPFTSRAMINSIKAKLPAGAQDPSRFELCPGCKTRIMPGPVRN